MCGIVGQLVLRGGEADAALIKTMVERLRHRGPDGGGIYLSGPIGLAHRRLAVATDLSGEGRQPMANEEGALWIDFDGEIYNRPELREDLQALGHRFITATDAEVVLHAYEEWGRDCLHRFNGVWAFAIWDERRHELFCARDRLGVKPFYYTFVGGSFLFASEIKALLVHPAVGRRPNDRMLAAFLAWGVADHTGETMYDGIFQLPPAHRLTVTERGAPEPERYWDLAVNSALREGRRRYRRPRTQRYPCRCSQAQTQRQSPGRNLSLGGDRLLDDRRPGKRSPAGGGDPTEDLLSLLRRSPVRRE